MARRSPRRRPEYPAFVTASELDDQIAILREIIARVERESAAHMRRCAELQMEIDLLKKAMTLPSIRKTERPSV